MVWIHGACSCSGGARDGRGAECRTHDLLGLAAMADGKEERKGVSDEHDMSKGAKIWWVGGWTL